MKRIHLALMGLLFAFLVACGTGTTSGAIPGTPAEREAAALVSVTSARQTATSLLQSGKISAADAQSVNDQGDAIVGALKAMQAMPASAPGLEGQLQTTLLALAALQTYLAQKGAPK